MYRECIIHFRGIWIRQGEHRSTKEEQKSDVTHHMSDSTKQKFSSGFLLKITNNPHGHSTHPILIYETVFNSNCSTHISIFILCIYLFTDGIIIIVIINRWILVDVIHYSIVASKNKNALGKYWQHNKQGCLCLLILLRYPLQTIVHDLWGSLQMCTNMF